MNMMLLGKYIMGKKFKVLNIDHVAFATKDIEKTKKIFSDILGMQSKDIEYIEHEKVDVLKLFTNGSNTVLELFQPRDDNVKINNFITKNGNGLHHIALEVDNLKNLIQYLNDIDIPLVCQKPKIGSDNKLITFIHPKYSTGMLIELCQKQ